MSTNTRYLPELRTHRSEHSLGLMTIPVFVDGSIDLSLDIQALKIQRGLDYVSHEFPSLLDFICKALLDIKNDGWLKKDELPISYENFRCRLTPRRIRILEDGCLEVGFADSGMFWGHEVVLRTDIKLTPVWVDIEG